MNSTHGAAAGGGGVIVASVIGVLTEQFHMSGTLASNWVTIGVGLATAIGALVVWFIRWRYPNAPALPGEAVLIPPDAPAAPIAIVPQPAPAPVVAAVPTPLTVAGISIPPPPPPAPLVTPAGTPIAQGQPA